MNVINKAATLEEPLNCQPVTDSRNEVTVTVID